MFNSSVLLKALPSFWRDRFEDKSLLQSIYSYIGGYLADSYGSMFRSLSSGALASTPLEEPLTWSLISLSSIHRLSIPAAGEEGTSLVVYGIREQEHLLTSCQRIYGTPKLGGPYLTSQKDYIILDVDSPELEDLIQLSDNTCFFSRFSKCLVFFRVDPLTYFENAEPDVPRAFYPLAFKVRTSLLTTSDEDTLTQTSITMSVGDYSAKTSIIAVEHDDIYTTIAVDPDAFTPFSEGAVVSIEGISTDPLALRALDNYSITVDNSNIWAFDCSIDKLELYRRWGYLLDPGYLSGTPIKSSPRYHRILLEVLAARLRGLSSNRLENIASLYGGSDVIEFSSLNDFLLTIDLVEHKIISQLTEYSLLKNAVINLNVVKNCNSVVTVEGKFALPGSTVIELVSYNDYLLILQYYIANRQGAITIELANGDIVGRVLLPTTNNSFIIVLESGQTLPNTGFYIRYLPGEIIFIPSVNYRQYVLQRDGGPTIGTIINPLVKVSDISSGLDDKVTSGVFIPADMWEVGQTSRREISLRLSPFSIGNMSNHRIGDYELYIPTGAATGTNFDRITDDNPNGYAWSTAYKLYSHFLRSKIAIIEPVNNIGVYSNLDSVLKLTQDIMDRSKRVLPLNSVPLVDFVPSPTSSLEVVVTRDNTDIVIGTQSYTGVGSLGFTLVIQVPDNITQSADVSDITHILIYVDNILTAYPIQVLGMSQGVILVELVQDEITVYTALQQDDSIGIVYDGNNIVNSVSLLLTTNHVGSQSVLMVVGGSYPEYTAYYDYGAVTISEWLQVEVE